MSPVWDNGLSIIRGPATRRRRALRFGVRPRSRWSQRRIVSRPILIPMIASPWASVSADSPACASRSSSSRCGSNCAVAWLRGWRAWATAWASVVGGAGVSGEWMGNDMGTDGSPYAWRMGRARGAPRARSKRQRLDVGVLPSFFVLFLLRKSLCSYRSFLGSFISSVVFVSFVVGVIVELVSQSFRFQRLMVQFPGGDFFGPELVAGGGGC